MDINKLIEQAIQEKMKSTEILKHVRGTVVSFDEDYISVVVNIYGKQVTVINKSGCELVEGDEVTIYYWTNVSNGYIAFVNNRTAPKQGGFNIQNAVVMTENQADTYTYANEIINVDVKNSIQVKYGNGQNMFFVNGHPVFASALTGLSNSSDVFSFGSEIYNNSRDLISCNCDFVQYIEGSESVGAYTQNIKYHCDICGGFYKIQEIAENGVWLWRIDVNSTFKDGELSTIIPVQYLTVKDVNGNSVGYISVSDMDYSGFTSINTIGMVVTTSQIKPPNSQCPYGYAVCRLLVIASGATLNSTNELGVSNLSSSTFNFAFANEAEYQYAITTLSKSELTPS